MSAASKVVKSLGQRMGDDEDADDAGPYEVPSSGYYDEVV